MPSSFVTRLTFLASSRPEAQEGLERLTARYGDDPTMAAFVDQVSAQVNKVKGTLQAPTPGQADAGRGSQGGK